MSGEPSERALWLTLPAAPTGIAFGWFAWLVGSVSAAGVLTELIGPAGAMLAVLSLGWVLGRRALVPSDCLRRHHLDDAELTVLGPGRTVRRLPWSQIATITQEGGALRVEARGTRLTLPLGSLVASAGWSALLTRVVAALAAEMWALIEDGERVRLEPRSDPPTRALVWWAYVPAVLACGLGPGARGVALVLAVALAERGLALLRRRAAAVTLDREGLAVRRRGRRVVVPWSEAEVVRASEGLFVAVPGGACDLIASRLPNFWAAAPVIETKAQLGTFSAPVQFRVRLAGGTLAVVGEVEPAA